MIADVTARALSISLFVAALVLAPGSAGAEKQLLWGDTHLHTSNSFDAYLNRNMTADPATAYRFAKGLPVIHPFNRARVQINTPLDFLVVADHAEYLGVMRTVVEQGIPREGLGATDRLRAWVAESRLRGVVERDEGREAFQSLLPADASVEEAAADVRVPQIPNAEVMSRTVWEEAIRTADAFNEPGQFTTLIGWEWSSVPAGANLHRVVFTSADASVAARFRPWSSVDSAYPEDLWAWLEETSAEVGAEFVAIPHNSNISKGYMFGETSLRGKAMTPEYAQLRARWEPVVEATQIKGDSETHPELSPDDPFADFETYAHYIEQDPAPYQVQEGDYVRSALRRGLAIEERIGFNPYRFGLIGSTDAHTGLATAEEPNFWGKMSRDSVPENKQATRRGPSGPSGWSMAAQGLAAVWAEANTRDAILAAFRRKEVYATTGPRIAVRVHAGWDLRQRHLTDTPESLAARGVPMGGVLTGPAGGRTPHFVIRARMDVNGAHLDRVQVVKGWIDAAGATHERVHDVVWAGEREPGPDGRVPAIGSTVDLARGSYTNEIGSPELARVWRDPDFDAAASAFYYVRVLEIPTPRHSVFDAIALELDPKETPAAIEIQERAYTSPIWYAPGS